jgi:hypothetical protein
MWLCCAWRGSWVSVRVHVRPARGWEVLKPHGGLKTSLAYVIITIIVNDGTRTRCPTTTRTTTATTPNAPPGLAAVASPHSPI